MKRLVFALSIIASLVKTQLGAETCRFSQPGSRDEAAISGLQDSEFALFLTISHAPQQHNPWLLTTLYITRLHNPKLKIYVFVHVRSFLENKEFAQALANLHVEVRVTDAFRSKGSAMAKIRMYLRKETGGEEFMDRHCAYAQEAMRAGIKRLMSIDGDMALFAPATDLAAPYAEDLVSACVFTSQFLIVNRLDALHAYCNYMSNYFTQNVSTLVALAGLVGRSPDHYLHISDMELLQLFLTQTPADAVSRRILCPEAPGVPRCDASYAGCLLSSQVQAVESFFKLRTNQSRTSDPWVACANLSGFSSLVDWGADSRGVPVPIHRGSGECLPVMHFQGACKGFIPVFVEYYRELVREAFKDRLGTAGAAGGAGAAAGGGQRRRLWAGELPDGLEWLEEWLGVT